jgi:undecaprenyl-diphosphatase
VGFINLWLFEQLNGLAGSTGALDQGLVFAARDLPWVLAAGLIAWAWFRRRQNGWGLLAGLALAGGLAALFARVVQALYFHPRPGVMVAGGHELLAAAGNSFPSVHAAFFFAVGFLLYWQDKRWGRFYIWGAVLISLARVAAGVHWPGDIAGGLFTGLVAAGLVGLIVRSKLKYRY